MKPVVSYLKVRSAKTHVVVDVELPTQYHDCMEEDCHHDPSPRDQIYYTTEEAYALVEDLEKAIREVQDNRDVAKQMKPNRKKGRR